MAIIFRLMNCISNNTDSYFANRRWDSVHSYKLRAEDVLMMLCGVVLVWFVTCLNANSEYVIGACVIFCCCLITYGLTLCTSAGLLQDCYFTVLLVVLLTLDQQRLGNVDRSPFRMASMMQIYMFAMTGLRRNWLILVSVFTAIARAAITTKGQDHFLTVRLIQADVTFFLFGLLVYAHVYTVGCEIHRFRNRPRLILQDIPQIIPREVCIFQELMYSGAEPPLVIDSADSASILLHKYQTKGERQKYFALLASRAHEAEVRKQAEMQQTISEHLLRGQTIKRMPPPAAHSPASAPSPPTRGTADGRGVPGADGIGVPGADGRGVPGANGRGVPGADGRKVDQVMRDRRMRERMLSLSLRATPADFLNKTEHKHTTKRRLTLSGLITVPGKSQEAVIIEATSFVRTVQMKQSLSGAYVDPTIERWYLAWKLVWDTRIGFSNFKLRFFEVLMATVCSAGVTNRFLQSVAKYGFRSRRIIITYAIRVGIFVIVSVAYLLSIRLNKKRYRMEWVELAQKSMWKFRLYGLFLLVGTVVDSILLTDQARGETSMALRCTTFLQLLAILPGLLCIPPVMLTVLYAVAVFVISWVTWQIERVPIWQAFHDYGIILAGTVSAIVFVSLPRDRVGRAVFGSYAAPYLLYLEGLKPLPKII